MPGPLQSSVASLLAGALGKQFPLTRFFLGLCVTVYLITVLAGGGLKILGMSPRVALEWGALFGDPRFGSLGLLQPWRYLSAAFVHFGLLHIVFNMMALWDFGRATERQLGSARFVVIFVVTAVAGFVASDVWFSAVGKPFLTAGASGGLFGLVGALVGYLYARRDPVWKKFLMRVAILAAIFAIALPVNNAAHIGGFAGGVPLGYLAYKEHRPDRHDRLLGWVAGTLAVLSVASVALSRVYS